MHATRIVEALDVLKDPRLGIFSLRILLAVDTLLLQRREENLHDRVVVAVSPTTHAWCDRPVAQHPLKLVRRVLHSSIGVHNQGTGRLPIPQSHCQRPTCQAPIDGWTHCPANHPSAEQIQKDRKEQPAVTGRDVRDISGPLLVRRLGSELPVQHVGRHRMMVLRAGCDDEFLPRTGAQPHLPHQARNAIS